MHLSSLDHMKQFVEEHLQSKREEELVIVDLGSQNIGGSYRQLFDPVGWQYVGVDVVNGPNVDVVLDDAYQWGEIKSETVDVLISGQAFEHIEYFWLTVKEIARVLKPGGICCIIAPSGGPEHRYPVDCWRFYPDGFRALGRYAQLDVLSAQTHWDMQGYPDDSAQWADSIFVAQKPYSSLLKGADQELLNSKFGKEREPFYQGTFSPQDDTALGKISRLLTSGTRVLELGPATGYFTKYMSEELGCAVDCVERSQEMAKSAKQYCNEMLVADLDETDLEDHFEIETFDYIIAADVLEHLKNPQATLKSCRKVLKPEGKLLLSVPNVAHAAVVGNLLRGEFRYTEDGLLDRTHIHFFTKKSLMDSLREAKFCIETVDAVMKLPEETEVGDDFIDLPQAFQDALYSQANSLVYQFIVMASLGPLVEDNEVEFSNLRSEDFVVRRELCLRELKEENYVLGKNLDNAELVLSEKLEEIKMANERLHALSGGLRLAEELAFGRLSENEKLHKALRDAQEYVIEREDKISILGSKILKMEEALVKVQELSKLEVTAETFHALSKGLRLAEELAFGRLSENEKLHKALRDAQEYVIEREDEISILGRKILKMEEALVKAQELVSVGTSEQLNLRNRLNEIENSKSYKILAKLLSIK